MFRPLLIFRHGEPAERMCGCCRGGEVDCELSPSGVQQTEKNVAHLLERFRGQLQDVHVITTGLRRTDVFGELMKTHGAQHHVEPRLRDMRAGVWSGKSWDTIKMRWPEQYEAACSHAEDLAIPGGEATVQFRARILDAFGDIVAREAGALVVVGHKCVNEVILAAAEGRGSLRFLDACQPVGSFHELHQDGDAFRVSQKRAVVHSMEAACDE